MSSALGMKWGKRWRSDRGVGDNEITHPLSVLHADGVQRAQGYRPRFILRILTLNSV